MTVRQRRKDGEIKVKTAWGRNDVCGRIFRYNNLSCDTCRGGDEEEYVMRKERKVCFGNTRKEARKHSFISYLFDASTRPEKLPHR